MTLKHTFIASLIGALSILCASAVWAAQANDASPGGHPAWSGHPHGDMVATAQQHLAKLKAELKVTAAQEAAWQAFATQMTQSMAARQADQKNRKPPSGTAPERMAQHIEMTKLRLADMSAGQVALHNLYSALSPEQQALADKHFARMEDRRRGGGHGRCEHGEGQ